MKEIDTVKKDLEIFREEINQIDNQIIDLLNLRGKIAQKIGKLKKDVDFEIYHPHRERIVIQRMKDKSVLFNDIQIEAIWKEIINACKLIQET